jgi:hypothetical protein
MEVSGQLHAQAAKLPEKKLPVLIGQEAGWAPEAVWTGGEEKKNPFTAPAGN